MPAADDISAGYAALKSADWAAARQHFENALAITDSPEAHDGLGIALWWHNEIPASHVHRSAAFNGCKVRGDYKHAAMIACWLAREQVFLHGNAAGMQGWFARAERLLADVGPCIEQAWYALLHDVMLASPAQMEQTAAQTIEAARAVNDSDLEALSLAFGGSAQLIQGHVTEGMAKLDEAMTMTTGGEVRDFMVFSEIFCVMLSACELAGDLTRSDHWCRAAFAFMEQHQAPFLGATCRTTYGSLLSASGRWQDAETMLTEAIRTFESGHYALRVHAVICLADLRVHQGRVEEAAVLLDGLEDQGSAAVPLARLHLAKGETAVARAILEQALQAQPDPLNLLRLPVLLLLVDVLMAYNDLAAARDAAAQLMRLAQQSRSPHLIAQAELAVGRVSLFSGEISDAQADFHHALDHLQAYQQSLLAGQIRLHMSQSLDSTDKPAAIVWARAALATFERIGAVRDAAQARARLRQLGAAPSSAPRLNKPLTQRESEILNLLALGLTNREIAERLVISPKTAEHHVSQILSKLNLRSRAEAAAFIASGKLVE